MERLPPPPPSADLPEIRRREVRELPAGTRIWRIYPRSGKHPGDWNGFRHFGPLATGRFDHHLPPPRGQDRAILYGAVGVGRRRGSPGVACVAEFFQDTRTIDPARIEPWLVGFALARTVRLLDVTTAWITRAGGNQAISSGERSRARAWSRAIYERFPEVEGLHYVPSTYGPGRAVALYERAEIALPVRSVFHRPLSDPGLRDSLRRAARVLNYDLL